MISDCLHYHSNKSDIHMSVSISIIIIIETIKHFFEVGLVSFIFLLTIDYKLMFNVTPQFNMLCFTTPFQVLIDLFHLIPYIILCIGVTLYNPGNHLKYVSFYSTSFPLEPPMDFLLHNISNFTNFGYIIFLLLSVALYFDSVKLYF